MVQECCPPPWQNAWQQNNYAIIYDHDHSKHINHYLRCRQHNGATCLNCKVDFWLEMPAATSLFSPTTFSTPPYFWNASSLGQSLSSSAHFLFTLPVLTHAVFHLPLPFSPSFCESSHHALVWSKTALWHWARHPGNRKHQTTKEQLAKRQIQRDGHTHKCVYVSLCVYVINKWIN